MSKRQVTNYNEEFKKSSAKLAAESEQSVSETAKALGVNSVTLHGWINKYYPHSKVFKKVTNNDLEAENKQLRKELARVKEERDILKKAAAYFANQTR